MLEAEGCTLWCMANDPNATGSEEELARLAADGDQAAFAELFRRHFASLYDYSVRMSRDRDVAALVVQASFLSAYGTLSSSEPQAPFKLQVLASAHRDLPERLRRRRGAVTESDEPYAAADSSRLADPEQGAVLQDLAPIVWHTAAEMRLEDYELLDLSLRQGLDVSEIAAVLRSRPATVQSRLARATAGFESGLAARLLLSRGRRACVDLDFLIGQDEWSAALGRRVVRHLQSCQTCQATRERLPGGVELLAALTPVPPPPGWEDTILDRLRTAAGSGQLPAAAVIPPAATAEAAATATPAAPASLGPPGGGDGTAWHDPDNWNTGFVPGPTDEVVIDVAGDPTVIYSQDISFITRLDSEEALTISGGSLSVATTVQVNNTFTLSGGTLADVQMAQKIDPLF